MKLLKKVFKSFPMRIQVRAQQQRTCTNPKHLICFKNWTSNMVMQILESALNLKCYLHDTHSKRLNVLADTKVMILQEVNEPFLNMAVSKAATLLGGYDVNITDHLVWENDYMGRIFSSMADVIFVATMTHMCVQRFSEQSSVPVLCMRSRTHATIQALSTIMAIIEEYGTLRDLNLAYFGSPHPVLNSYLLLCPMLGANIKFKCCCNKCPVSPLLYKMSEDMCSQAHTGLRVCKTKDEVLKNAQVIIAGPANAKKINEFKLSVMLSSCWVRDFDEASNKKSWFFRILKHILITWIFFHTGPRGHEVEDNLFSHSNSRTFGAFENYHYISAALMANVVKGHTF